MTLPSAFDNLNFPKSRNFINSTRNFFINNYLSKNNIVCDIGNQGKIIPNALNINMVTLDISSSSNPDIIADITKYNKQIPSNHFDALMCTEVLEHVVDPFAAVRELRRITKVGGFILVTTPLNARIHGPIPDCWRFTEFGLKVLFRDFEIVYFDKLDTEDRNLFPLHYGLIMKKSNDILTESDPGKLIFQKID